VPSDAPFHGQVPREIVCTEGDAEDEELAAQAASHGQEDVPNGPTQLGIYKRERARGAWHQVRIPAGMSPIVVMVGDDEELPAPDAQLGRRRAARLFWCVGIGESALTRLGPDPEGWSAEAAMCGSCADNHFRPPSVLAGPSPSIQRPALQSARCPSCPSATRVWRCRFGRRVTGGVMSAERGDQSMAQTVHLPHLTQAMGLGSVCTRAVCLSGQPERAVLCVGMPDMRESEGADRLWEEERRFRSVLSDIAESCTRTTTGSDDGKPASCRLIRRTDFLLRLQNAASGWIREWLSPGPGADDENRITFRVYVRVFDKLGQIADGVRWSWHSVDDLLRDLQLKALDLAVFEAACDYVVCGGDALLGWLSNMLTRRLGFVAFRSGDPAVGREDMVRDQVYRVLSSLAAARLVHQTSPFEWRNAEHLIGSRVLGIENAPKRDSSARKKRREAAEAVAEAQRDEMTLQRRATLHGGPETEEEGVAAPDDHDCEWSLQDFLSMIESDTDRERFRLHHVVGWSREEIARTQNITLNTLRQSLFRALRAIEEGLKDRGYGV